MFGLFNHPLHPQLATTIDSPKACGLMYVYVKNEYRGLGFGKQVIEKAKELASNTGAKLILLDTLKPSLNGLYKGEGAEVVCEGGLYSHGTDILRVTL
jgi:diamine N-acetyltransferase